MNKNPLISVVIPVYNVEKYLAECLESVIHQTFKEIEIICIDDCSKDSSLRILLDYEQKDSRITVLKNEKNRGLSAVRNLGLEKAAGKYVYFLDSDDAIEENCLQILYDAAEKENLEGVLFDYRFIGNEIHEECFIKGRKHRYPGVYTGMELLGGLVDNDDVIYGVQMQFWKKEMLINNRILFYEGIYHEDILFTFQALQKAERVKCLDRALYNLRRRSDSITTMAVNFDHFEGRIIGIAEILKLWAQECGNLSGRENQIVSGYLKGILWSLLKTQKHLTEWDIKKSLEQGDSFADGLYQIYRDTRKRIENENYIDRYELEKIRKFQNVIVYGTGKIGRRVIHELVQNELDNISVCITELKDNGQKILGIEVQEIGSIAFVPEDTIIIIASGKKFRNEMKRYAAELGHQNIYML